jgi:hypothetical protein
MVLVIMTLSIICFNALLSKNNSQHNDSQHNIVNIMIVSIMIVSITIVSIMIVSITTVSTMVSIVTLSINVTVSIAEVRMLCHIFVLLYFVSFLAVSLL